MTIISFRNRVASPVLGNFTITALSETCPIYPAMENMEGFISDSDDPLAPWSGVSILFQGTDNCPGRDMIGSASLIYRYRLEFEKVTKLTSITVSGAAFWGPNNVLRVLDENRNVVGNVYTFGGNTIQTQVVTLQDVEGKIFFVEEFDTSSAWRFRQRIVVNGQLP